MIRDYTDQVKRMLRGYNRLPERPFLVKDDLTPEIQDNYIHFFQDCYHLKDWIKNDTSLNKDVCDAVEKYVTDTEALTFIASIANATKHLKLSNKYKRNVLDIETHATNFCLIIASKKKDFGYEATHLATEGVRAWQKFFENHGLHKIEVSNRSKIKIKEVTDSSVTFIRPKVS